MQVKATSEKAKGILEALVDYAPVEFVEVPAEAKPVPTVPPKNKKRVLIDPGHSEAEPGARSNSGKAEEEDLNRIQASYIAVELRKAGHVVDIFDPAVDDLYAIGKKAAGYDLFLSLHHNSYDGDSDPGCEVFVPAQAFQSDKKAAQLVVNAISKALDCDNRGVKEANFAVLREAGKATNGIVMLVESYFLNPYDAETAKKRTLLAAAAIADALSVVLSD